MKELFYFSKSNVMVQVQYSYQSNALRYASHRSITEVERNVIERYFRENVATEAKNPRFAEAAIQYGGIDYKLINHLNQFQAVKPFGESDQRFADDANPFESLINKDVETSVQDLIHTSMSNYYFEKIGNAILEVRKAIRNEADTDKLREYRRRLEELVSAYNQYSNKPVSLQEVLPKELNV